MLLTSSLTLGVEEEFLVVDPLTRAARPDGGAILAKARSRLGDEVQAELKLSQIESATPVCATLAEVRSHLVRLRRELSEQADLVGLAIAATGSHPFAVSDGDDITPKPAYLQLERDYQQVAREQLVCGCHVHVDVGGREAAVEVLNRVRPWLAPILALSANSPFWMGQDTGYASYRTEIWRRWPLSCTPDAFESVADYDRLVALLLATGSIDDPARIYWDVRLSARFETLEIRVADACLTVDEAVMLAGLARALARTCQLRAEAGEPPPRPRPELLRAATWRAARYGLEGELIDVPEGRARPAPELVEALLELVRPSLEEAGDWDEVSTSVADTVARGTGAARQRRAFARSGRLEEVVDLVLVETRAGTGTR